MSEIHQIYLSCSFYIFKKIQTLIYFVSLSVVFFLLCVYPNLCFNGLGSPPYISAVKTQSHVIRLIQSWTKYMELFP